MAGLCFIVVCNAVLQLPVPPSTGGTARKQGHPDGVRDSKSDGGFGLFRDHPSIQAFSVTARRVPVPPYHVHSMMDLGASSNFMDISFTKVKTIPVRCEPSTVMIDWWHPPQFRSCIA